MNVSTLIGYARPYRVSLAFCLALMLLETASSLAIPWLGGRFASGILVKSNINLNIVLLGLLLLFAVQAVLKFANGYILGRTAERILADLRIRVYDHLQALPLNFYHQQKKGDILALITNEVARLSTFITGTLLNIFPLLLTLIGAVALMARIDAQLGGLVTVLIPLFFLLLKIIGRRLRPLATQLQEADAAVVAIAEENLDMLPAIKTFTREVYELQRHEQHVRRVMELSTLQQRIVSGLEPAIQFVAAAGVVLMLWLASGRVSDGSMTPSELVSFLLYAALLTRPVSGLAQLYGQTQMVRGTLKRLQAVLNEKPESALSGRKLKLARGTIEFRNLDFAYPGQSPTLENINLYIRAGETVAWTGENGAGKSTLVHLLMRLHEPDSGQILISDTDIANVSLHSLRSQDRPCSPTYTPFQW